MQSSAELIEGLKEFLRIPSVSTAPEHQPDIRRCAAFVRDALTAAGLENAAFIESEGRNPLVYADWLHAPGKPTILFYGHYDVQPPDPLDEWVSPPFEPEVRGDNIYARGAVDDKGQVYLQIKAIEKLYKRDGRLPVNVKVLIEGEEEVGGEHIEQFVASKDPRAQADAAIVCDTEMFAPEMPTLCVGLRGIVYGEIHVQTAASDLHSGVYGGVAPNAIQAACEVVTALKDRHGKIHIPGFGAKVVPPTHKEYEAWAKLPFNVDDYRDKEVKVSALTGDPTAMQVLERTWAQPTFEVHGIRGGFTGEGAKTVIPCKAVIKVSARLVAEQDPEEAVEQIQKAVHDACPAGATAEFRLLHGAAPSLVNTDNVFIEKSAAAMKEIFGKDTVYIRSGGSIPIVGAFDRYLNMPSVMMGFGLPDDNLHAPNEKFYLPNFFRGIDAVARYLELLGEA